MFSVYVVVCGKKKCQIVEYNLKLCICLCIEWDDSVSHDAEKVVVLGLTDASPT